MKIAIIESQTELLSGKKKERGKKKKKKRRTGKNLNITPQSLLSRRRRASVLIIINTVTVSCYIGEIKIKSRSSNYGFIYLFIYLKSWLRVSTRFD